MELHPDEGRLSGDEEVAEREEMGEAELDKGLKIQRTVTQVRRLPGGLPRRSALAVSMTAL